MVQLSPEYLTAGKAGSGVGCGTPWERGQIMWSNLLTNMLITGLFGKGINAVCQGVCSFLGNPLINSDNPRRIADGKQNQNLWNHEAWSPGKFHVNCVTI